MKCSLADNFEGNVDEDDEEDEAMAAIREMQRAEEEEQARIEAEEIVLQQQAIQIEKEAAQKEKEEKARMEQEERKAASTSSSSSSSSFNQFSPKSSIGLKASSGEMDSSEGNVNQGEHQQPSQQSFNEFAAKVNERKQQQQRHPSSRINGSNNGISSSGSINMGMGSNMDALSEIEARLRQAQQRGQGNTDINDSSQSTIDKEDQEMRMARYAVEYRFKRPVEKVIKAYEQKPIFDLYSILAVEETADATDIKFGYREMALLIHPDKNPHPNAKLAFDFLQEAYKILTSSEQREAYDKKLTKLRSTKLKLHKWKKKIENFYYNSKSKIQLLQYQG